MASAHKRNVEPMQHSARCGAKTRAGAPCRAPRISGGKRCRMHGGKGSGAPRGNTNALKAGHHTGVVRARRKELTSFIRRAKVLIALAEAEQASASTPAADFGKISEFFAAITDTS